MIEEIKVGDKNVLFARHNGKLIYPKYASSENLVLHYDFSGMKNSDVTKAVAEDLSGNGNNGVLQNFAYIDGSGYLDNALIFDGIDDFITIPKPLIDLNNFTYSEGINVLSFRGENVATVVDGVVEIGGRNLLLNTKNERSGVYPVSPSYILTEKPVAGESYTLSGWFKFSEGKLKLIMAYNSGGNVELFKWTNDAWVYEEWFYFSRTFTWRTGSANDTYVNIYGGLNDELLAYAKLIKLEKGNKATDWTPAPEDFETTTLKPLFDKKIKSALYWNRALTDEELLQVYNIQIKRT